MSDFTLRRDSSGVAVAGYDEQDDMVKIKSMQKKWRSDFSGTVLADDKWEVVQTGSGQSISITANKLKIATGTTASAETILLGREIFTVPVRAMFGFYISQRIANQEFYLELVSVDPVTGIPDGQHSAFLLVDGTTTTATYTKYGVQYDGEAPLVSSNTSITPSVISTSGHIQEIELFADEAWFHTRAMDSTSSRNQSMVRHQQIPDPNCFYKVRIRIKNGSTPPASNTDFYCFFVTVSDYAELTAEITAGRGISSAGQSIAVQVVNSPTDYAYIYNRGVWSLVTSTLLGISGVYTGTGYDIGSTGLYNVLRWLVDVSHDGVMQIQQSHDNATWITTDTLNCVAGCNKIETPIYLRYVRVVYTNGAVAQTTFRLHRTAMAVG